MTTKTDQMHRNSNRIIEILTEINNDPSYTPVQIEAKLQTVQSYAHNTRSTLGNIYHELSVINSLCKFLKKEIHKMYNDMAEIRGLIHDFRCNENWTVLFNKSLDLIDRTKPDIDKLACVIIEKGLFSTIKWEENRK